MKTKILPFKERKKMLGKRVLCSCGCGEYLLITKWQIRPIYIKEHRTKKYLIGHGMKGKKQTKEHIIQRIESAQRTKNSSEWENTIGKRMREKMIKLRNSEQWKNTIGKIIREKLSRDRKGKHFSPATEFKKGCVPITKKNFDVQKVIRLYNSGLDLKEMSEKFDCSKGPIIRILKENNIKIRNISETTKGRPNNSPTKFKKGNKPINPFKKGDPRITGKNNHNWQGGISFEPYGKEFSLELKKQIRVRDNHICQECGKHQKELFKLCKNGKVSNYKLHIHHIDYNKQNNNSLNLISLCLKCHMKTNVNRKHWARLLKERMVLREIFNPNNLLIFNENKQLIGMEKIK